MLKKIFSRLSSKNSYQQITAKDIAEENGVEYISTVEAKRFGRGKFVNAFYSIDDRYILLYPPNDGAPTCPIEWYMSPTRETRVPHMIMNNQSAFKGITNLSELLLQMIKLYEKYIDADVFISWYGFVAKLEDVVGPNYCGRASLAVNQNLLRNDEVKPGKLLEAKKYLVNDFLDHYIGWNFGVAVTSAPELEKTLLEFNELVISKGLRQPAGTGFDVWCSEDVQHYNLKTA